MRLFNRFAAVLLAGLLFAPIASAESARSLYNKGAKAEARQDYEAAYDFYKQAYNEKPQDLRYRVKFERMTFLAAASHIHKGLNLRDSGNLQGALAEFQKAAEIDPSSFIAKQEVQRTQEMIQGASNPAGTETPSQPKMDMLRKRIQEAKGPVELAPIQNQVMTMKMSGDTKRFYETLGNLAGLNVMFDPDYQSRQLPTLDLNRVTVEDALNMVALESNTFWRPVTSNTIFVAQDTPAKRKQFEQSVIKVFYLQNYSQPSDIQDIATILRQILNLTGGVLPNNAAGAVIVRGTPDQVAMADKIVDDFDKAKPEVIVDVAIMQVRRDKLRNLGFLPPQTIAVQLQPANANTTSNTNTNTGNTSNTGTNTGSNTNVNGLTLNTFKNLNANNFAVSVPQSELDFLFSDSNSKLLQNPQIRASDGQKATLKIGDKIPIATGSFQPGIGGVGINPLVNTQFQFQDVGVNVEITPHVHGNREVSLKIAMVISEVTGNTTIGGIQQPIISQRTIDHDIRLKEGEVNLLGGIFENTDTHDISGWPGLAQVPILKYFFGKDHVEHIENEIVFVLIPRIVRSFDASEFNNRVIDVGTSNSIDLRREIPPAAGPGGQPPSGPGPSGQPVTPHNGINPGTGRAINPAPAENPNAGTPAPTPASTMGGVQAPPTAGSTSPPAAGTQPVITVPAVSASSTVPAMPAPAMLKFDPGTLTASTGGTFAVNVMLTGGKDVSAVPLQMTYDPKHLQVVNVASGELLSRDGQPVALVHRDDNGNLVISATRSPGTPGVTGDGTVVTVTFQAKEAGPSVLSITRPGAKNSAQQSIPVLGSQMTINVR